MCVCSLTWLCPTYTALWTVARQAPLSMEFSRQEHCSGLHVILQGIFPTQGSNLHLLYLLHRQVDSLPLETPRGALDKEQRAQSSPS